ncbi:hypothetical protein [Viridibacillus arvi]|uniref:hypothetical protein n=1 Tax=Viridibacillus arvi TaxID=263475 RepID=UPI0038026FA6
MKIVYQIIIGTLLVIITGLVYFLLYSQMRWEENKSFLGLSDSFWGAFLGASITGGLALFINWTDRRERKNKKLEEHEKNYKILKHNIIGMKAGYESIQEMNNSLESIKIDDLYKSIDTDKKEELDIALLELERAKSIVKSRIIGFSKRMEQIRPIDISDEKVEIYLNFLSYHYAISLDYLQDDEKKVLYSEEVIIETTLMYLREF